MIHPDVSGAVALFGSLCGHSETAAAEIDIDIDIDNADYGAAVARIGTRRLRFRVGRVTPRKVGLFVAVWRRSPTGSTEPFPVDDVDHLVILTREGLHSGQFVFPRSALQRHGIVSVAGQGGKRGFRVYPPWSRTSNAQAIRTQAWQGAFFLDTSDGVDLERLRELLDP
ncbi:MepB family protein [Cryobacterium zongtaii]|uniref:MepB family protein n=1 Tax=Cryobacterium zongtaii TaxID=1259217 RepID=UPI001FCCB630|nr:MepB family protein [Cryobacterium zongtaii]